jgi:5'-nucleotidase
MRLLLINDDGVHAPGLSALALRLLRDGHELSIIAPLGAHSGSGTSLGGELKDQLTHLEVVELPGLADVRTIAVDGTPALAALLACHGLLEDQPDLVISGINPGNNVGRLALHSGTLGAAMTVAAYGWPAIAVSCAGRPNINFEATADLVASRLGNLITDAKNGVVLNVNYPPAWTDEAQGIRVATLAEPKSGDVAVVMGEGSLVASINRRSEELNADTDLALLLQGFVTVTRLSPSYHEVLDVVGEFGE